jgi:hypothetical protein
LEIEQPCEMPVHWQVPAPAAVHAALLPTPPHLIALLRLQRHV